MPAPRQARKKALAGRVQHRFMALIIPARRVLGLVEGTRIRRRAALVLSCLLAAASSGGCAWLDAKQRQLALRPTPTRAADLAAEPRPGDERWTVPVTAEDGGVQQLALWWLPQLGAHAPALLYLHGTFRNLYGNAPKIAALREAGFSILAVDYRGWGDSSPIIPSEETIAADALVAWSELARRQPAPGRRVIFGHSMGGAVAVRLASGLRHGHDYGALVLESTFTRLPDVAAEAGFWGRVAAGVTTLEFDSLARIGRVDAPIVMLHGDADDTVPVQLGRRLRDAAPPGVRWVEFPGGPHSRLHSHDPDLYRETMRQLIDRLTPPTALPPATSTP
jgi:pimeloyl-ACP methyl ester carboxylesterase